MRDESCVQFLQWALPQMHMRWAGFRKVRGQVCKRVERRIRDLGLADIEHYRAYLEANADEWLRLDPLCRITISRFFRDSGVFAALARAVLPLLIAAMRERGESALRAWSAGCGSGEEPYTLAALWAMELQAQHRDVTVEIVATDADPTMLERARIARYSGGSLKDVPEAWRDRLFSQRGDYYELEPQYRRGVELLEQDVRDETPAGRFDLVFCRNLAFTYFDESVQLAVLKRILDTMHEGAALVLGSHERLPDGARGFSPWLEKERIYRKCVGTEPYGEKPF